MIETIINFHLSRYPAMQIQDLYKLIYQAAMGSEHAITDLEAVRIWFARELTELNDGPAEPLIDPISANGDIVRVHLRPFVASGHDPDLLLKAFIRTAHEYHGEIRMLEQYWQAAVDVAIFPAAQMNEYIRSMKEKNYPAVHHSPAYKQHYRPAYRIVALAFCPEIWL